VSWWERRLRRRYMRDSAFVYGWMRLDPASDEPADRRDWFALMLADQTGLAITRVYDALRLLEAVGAVKGEWPSGSPGPPGRRVYRIEF
jgi:hypothetical protein